MAQKLNRTPPVYKLTDLEGEPLQSIFYEQELQKVSVSEDKEYKIETIVNKRGKGKKEEVFVKWVGYPSKFNSWIKASNIKAL